MPVRSETLSALEQRLAERLLGYDRLDAAWRGDHEQLRPACITVQNSLANREPSTDGGEPDEIDPKADIDTGMSGLGGKLTVPWKWPRR